LKRKKRKIIVDQISESICDAIHRESINTKFDLTIKKNLTKFLKYKILYYLGDPSEIINLYSDGAYVYFSISKDKVIEINDRLVDYFSKLELMGAVQITSIRSVQTNFLTAIQLKEFSLSQELNYDIIQVALNSIPLFCLIKVHCKLLIYLSKSTNFLSLFDSIVKDLPSCARVYRNNKYMYFVESMNVETVKPITQPIVNENPFASIDFSNIKINLPDPLSSLDPTGGKHLSIDFLMPMGKKKRKEKEKKTSS